MSLSPNTFKKATIKVFLNIFNELKKKNEIKSNDVPFLQLFTMENTQVKAKPTLCIWYFFSCPGFLSFSCDLFTGFPEPDGYLKPARNLSSKYCSGALPISLGFQFLTCFGKEFHGATTSWWRNITQLCIPLSPSNLGLKSPCPLNHSGFLQKPFKMFDHFVATFSISSLLWGQVRNTQYSNWDHD